MKMRISVCIHYFVELDSMLESGFQLGSHANCSGLHRFKLHGNDNFIPELSNAHWHADAFIMTLNSIKKRVSILAPPHPKPIPFTFDVLTDSD